MPQNPSGAPDSDDKDAPRESARPPKTVSSFLMRRTRAMGSSGLQAATIGWVLAGCVFLGYLAGAWLDKRFGTQFWTPVLVLLGVVAGFREMFVTLGQVSKPQSQSKMQGQTKPNKVSTSTIKIDNSSATPTEAQARKRERLFAVPAPPTASFDARKPVAPISQVSADERELDTEAVLRALMNEDNEDEPQKDVKPQ